MRVNWLIDGRLAASGMPYPEDLPALRQQGIEAVLSLTERSPFPDGTPDSVEHLHLPVPDMTAPTVETLDRAVEFLRSQAEDGRSVLVHCAAGLGRTGTILAAYLVAEGFPPGDAIHRVREARPGSIETFEQEKCIYDYAESRRESRGGEER
jgi:atypical dual specificity phosphatase